MNAVNRIAAPLGLEDEIEEALFRERRARSREPADRHGPGLASPAARAAGAELCRSRPRSASWASALDAIYSPMPLYLAMGEIVWSASSNFLLVAVPLYVLLGEILLRSGIAERLYGAMSQWLSWLPGGLMHANIGASMGFAAHVGLQRRDGGDDRHRRDAADRPLPLRRAAFPGLGGCRRHAWHPDPALDQPDHLWLAHRDLGAAALPRRFRAGFPPGSALHGHDRRVLPGPARLVGRLAGHELAAAAVVSQGPAATARDLPGGHRQHLCRLRHADRVRGPRRRGGAHARRLLSTPDVRAC